MADTEGKTITCKAAVIDELNAPIQIKQIKVSPPPAGHIRIKLVASALCHSDLSILNGGIPGQSLPYVPGHEGAGIVESVGEGVTSVKKGDKVFTMFLPHCGLCPPCKAKKSNFCLDVKRKVPLKGSFMRSENLDGTTSFSTLDGKAVYYCMGCSSFSEYTIVPENSCVKVHSDTNLKNGCTMACGFLTGYGSSSNAVDIRQGEKVAVWGLGGVGLACVAGCKDKGATQIIGIDVNSEKEAVARKIGCTDFIDLSKLDPNITIKQKIFQLTTLGLDYGFVCVGFSKVLEDAVSCIGIGGTAFLVGVTKAFEKMTITSNDLLPNRSIRGALYGNYNIFEDVPKIVERYVAGKLPVDDLITNVFTLEQINDAVDLMKQAKGIRSVIHF